MAKSVTSKIRCHNKTMTWFMLCVCVGGLFERGREREIESHSIVSEDSCHVLSSPWRSPGGKNIMLSANSS